jgi:hypothetical protein
VESLPDDRKEANLRRGPFREAGRRRFSFTGKTEVDFSGCSAKIGMHLEF